ncbi:MAG TPA: hypothetical protein VM933_00950 [Acidimicrobiales bacterium]|nr:hypothetical protein [Acidimicrobiales bacterium]
MRATTDPTGGTADRRGEAHLWLLLEEALLAVRSADVEPWEAWRSYRAVADALISTDLVDASVAHALVGELDDALAVRGVIPAGAFSAAPWPDVDVLRRPRPATPPGAATTWLEAEIERHLDLLASFSVEAQGRAARDLVRIVGGPVRAFEAVGHLSGRDAVALQGEVVASLDAAGVDPGGPAEPDAEPRAEWVAFLRNRPPSLPEPFVSTDARLPARTLGPLADTTTRLDAIAWTTDAIRLELTVRPPRGEIRSGATTAPLHARILDDTGCLHLGQPVRAGRSGGGLHVFLRPGFGPGVRGFDLRLTRGGERLEVSVPL